MPDESSLPASLRNRPSYLESVRNGLYAAAPNSGTQQQFHAQGIPTDNYQETRTALLDRMMAARPNGKRGRLANIADFEAGQGAGITLAEALGATGGSGGGGGGVDYYNPLTRPEYGYLDDFYRSHAYTDRFGHGFGPQYNPTPDPAASPATPAPQTPATPAPTPSPTPPLQQWLPQQQGQTPALPASLSGGLGNLPASLQRPRRSEPMPPPMGGGAPAPGGQMNPESAGYLARARQNR